MKDVHYWYVVLYDDGTVASQTCFLNFLSSLATVQESNFELHFL